MEEDLEVQRKTYLSIILSNTYSSNSFAAKSITLDFLFGFKNPYTAIVCLNECLNDDNYLAKIGLNCIYGILLAVEEYAKFFQTTIGHKFIETLIEIITYKIEDVSIDNYNLCMEKILEFIGNNINFKLIIPFIDLVNVFLYCEGEHTNRNKIFEKYLNVLDFACKRLLKENSKLLYYKISTIRNELNDKNIDKNPIIDKVCNTLNSIYSDNTTEVLLVSNVKEKAHSIVNQIQKTYQYINIEFIEKEEVMDSLEADNSLKIIFLIDLNNDDYCEMLYLFGVTKGMMKQNQLFAVFYNTQNHQTNVFLKNLIACYSDDSNFQDKLTNWI